MERGEEEEEGAEPEEDEGRRGAGGLDAGGCSSGAPPLRFFRSPWCSKPRPPPCCPESPTPARPWEFEGSGGDGWT